MVSDGLSTTRVAGRERRRDLPDRHHQRVVPRRDLAADADRLAADVARCARPCTRRPTGPPASGRRRRRSGAGRRAGGSSSLGGQLRAACRCCGTSASTSSSARASTASANLSSARCRSRRRGVAPALERRRRPRVIARSTSAGAGDRRGGEHLAGARVDQVARSRRRPGSTYSPLTKLRSTLLVGHGGFSCVRAAAYRDPHAIFATESVATRPDATVSVRPAAARHRLRPWTTRSTSPAGPRDERRPGDGPAPVRRARGRAYQQRHARAGRAGRRRGRRGRGRGAPRCPRTPAPPRSTTCRRRLAERADEVARLITAENGKPLKWARAEVGRAVSTFRWAAEEARRFSGELQRLDTDPAGRRPDGAWSAAFPRGPVLGITPVQLPAQPGRAQGRPGDRGRRADRGQAGAGHPADRAAARRAARRDRPARRACSRCCRCPTTARAALVADPRLPVVSFTGSGPVGAHDPRRRAAQARDAGARRQRRGGGLRRLDGDATWHWAAERHRHVLQLPGRAELHRGAAGVSCTSGSTTASCPGSSPPSRRCAPATRPTRRPTSAR